MTKTPTTGGAGTTLRARLGFGRPPVAPVHAGADVDPVSDAERAAAAFRSAYGTDPVGVWRAPYPVPLIGDHIGGDARTLSTALPWGVSAAYAPSHDGTVEIRSTRPRKRPLRFGTARAVPAWAAPAAAVLRETTGAGARVLLDADPFGTDRETAAACAVLLAATEVQSGADSAADRAALARAARRILAAHQGTGTGATDPAAVLCAAPGQAYLLDPRGGRGRGLPLPLADAGLRLLVIDIGTAPPASLAARRLDECARAAAALGVPSLRDIGDLAGALRSLDDPALRRRARHAATETHRVNAFAGLLRVGAVADAGPILNASHLSLRDSFATVCPRLDTAADTAVRQGARGARAAGAGRHVVALVPTARLDRVCDGVRAAFAARRWPLAGLGTADPSPGARRVL